MMNGTGLMEYIRETFTLDGTSQRLVSDAIEYASKWNTSEHGVVDAIMFLIGGIGIEEDEVRRHLI